MNSMQLHCCKGGCLVVQNAEVGASNASNTVHARRTHVHMTKPDQQCYNPAVLDIPYTATHSSGTPSSTHCKKSANKLSHA
jgi:hypothetical protein